VDKKAISQLMGLFGTCAILFMTPRLTFGEQTSEKLSSQLTKRLEDPGLLARGQTHIYRGENLTAIGLPIGVIGFKPVWKPENHVSFFTAAQGWGLFSQKRCSNRQTDRIEITYGNLKLSKMIFELPGKTKPAKVKVQAAGKTLKSQFGYDNTQLTILLAKPITINAGQAINIIIETVHD